MVLGLLGNRRLVTLNMNLLVSNARLVIWKYEVPLNLRRFQLWLIYHKFWLTILQGTRPLIEITLFLGAPT